MPRISLLILAVSLPVLGSCQCWFRECQNDLTLTVEDSNIDVLYLDVVGVPGTDADELADITHYQWFHEPEKKRDQYRTRLASQFFAFVVRDGELTLQGEHDPVRDKAIVETSRDSITLRFRGTRRATQTGAVFVFADFPKESKAASKVAFTEKHLDTIEQLRVRVEKAFIERG